MNDMHENDDFYTHLKSGTATVCRAWKIIRKDGTALGFTDHDIGIHFDNMDFAAQTGLTARAVQQTTGLSVDNTEAIGALSSEAITEDDIRAGLYDDAEVFLYLVNWENQNQKILVFKGNFGEITSSKGAFSVELRGLSERMNIPVGRVLHSECSAALGDAACGIGLTAPNIYEELKVIKMESPTLMQLEDKLGKQSGWFKGGRLLIADGEGKGQSGLIKDDVLIAGVRYIELWQSLLRPPDAQDLVSLWAGCDKTLYTCKNKFNNLLNFRGFPHIPGEDWLRSPISTT